jgi:alpha-ketoglutarate-dependent taurine dioxygenase
MTNAVDIRVRHVKCTPNELTLAWQNDTFSVYNALWLRDNDPANRDFSTGQRTISLLDLPLEPKLRAAEVGPSGHVTLTWEDAPASVFSLAWLRAFDAGLRISHRPTRLPWLANPVTAFAHCDYREWTENPLSREHWLYYAGRDGLAFLTGVPVEEGMVHRVADQIGCMRETNSGAIFNVPSLPVHTGKPYRDPVPGFQLHHCLAGSEQSSKSIYLDGMAAAEQIRARDPENFKLLTETRILFRFQDATVDLVAERTMIELNTLGQFRAIYYNDRSIEPLPLKGPGLKKYYPAYRQLAELLRDPARHVVRKLEPGDLVLLDNARILHGHNASAGGARHLQGCYLDADGLYSSLAVLSRTNAAQKHDRKP